MTVSSTNVKDIYTADGVTRNWPITFPVSGLTDTDIKLYTTDTNGLSTEITTGFEIDLATPEVVYPTVASGLAIPSSGGIVLARELPLTQEYIDVETQGSIPLSSIESAFDRVHMIIQQLDEKIERAPIADIGENNFDASDYLEQLAAAVTSATASEVAAETAQAAAEAAQAAAEAAAEDAEAIAGWTFASQAEAEGGTLNTCVMTPLRTKQAIDANMASILSAVYFVGIIIESGIEDNPGPVLGALAGVATIGTWELWGEGRVAVCIDTTDPNFDTLDEEVGESTHTLTVPEVPALSVTFNCRSGYADGTSYISTRNNAGTSNNKTASTTGGGGAHNNIQKSKVLYRWKRTA